MLPILSYSFRRYIKTKIYSSLWGDSLRPKLGLKALAFIPLVHSGVPRTEFENLQTPGHYKMHESLKLLQFQEPFGENKCSQTSWSWITLWEPCDFVGMPWPPLASPWQWLWPPPSWLRPPPNLPVTGSTTCGCRWLWNLSPAAAWGPGGKPQR